MYIYYGEISDYMDVDDEDFDLDIDFLSGIVLKFTMTYSYPYYELLDEDDNNKTLVKTGDEKLYKDCIDDDDTGLKEIQQTADVKIYPNPANERVTLSLPSYMSEDVDIKIFNTLGLTVLSQHHISGEEINIDINSLPSGIYVVRCVKNNKITSMRFVKQ
jgi:hypothetical protein